PEQPIPAKYTLIFCGLSLLSFNISFNVCIADSGNLTFIKITSFPILYIKIILFYYVIINIYYFFIIIVITHFFYVYSIIFQFKNYLYLKFSLTIFLICYS